MKAMRSAVALGVGLALGAWACQSESPEAVDFGLAVGASAPGFSLVDQAGRTRNLEEFLNAAPVALLFYRSGDW